MKVTINDKFFEFSSPCTILDACKTAGIDIPNLCFDPRTEAFTSCYLCVVEVEGAKGFVPSCSTKISDGMVIRTNTEAVMKARKMALELLFSDHSGDCVAPCSMSCPAGIDIQSYLAYVANKDYESAIRIIKDRNPLPLVCGKVCPRPCELDCRRGLIDEAVAIDAVKRFVAEYDLNGTKIFLPKIEKEKDKSVAIVGAGPAGLSCAYYLRLQGYKVDVYEAKAKPGGMLMWGIPEYRLPKNELLKEISVIVSLGVNIIYNKTLGVDFNISDIRSKYDAVFVAIGAQKSTKMQVVNEDSEEVFGGIDFLEAVSQGRAPNIKGKDVVVVGGGNTAIDASRTATRLGANEVTIVYRRTRDEMPAEAFEVAAADSEGVKFKFLRAPIEVVKDAGKVKSLRCQVMELGEPDASGRRKPIPVKDKEDAVKADVIISAIGQSVDVVSIEGLELTKRGTIKVDEDGATYETNIDGVFAGGDAVSGPYIAIGAIAHGLLASKAIDSYVSKKTLERDKMNTFVFSMGRRIKDVNKDYLPQVKKAKREKSKELAVKSRLDNFREVEFVFTEAQAVKEANRCISCGCIGHDECKLRSYADQYKINTDLIKGELRTRRVDDSSEYLHFDSTKCIKCGKCVRVCDELKGLGALGFVNRGFLTDMLPALQQSIVSTSCVECGQCQISCPVCAIQDRAVSMHRVAQFEKTKVESICKECSVNCKITIHYAGKVPVRITPQNIGAENEPMLCKLGRYDVLKDYERSFGFDENSYKQLELYDQSIEDIHGSMKDSDIIINYGVDIVKYFSPVSSCLKKILDDDPKRNSAGYLYLSDANKVKELILGDKKTLLLVNEMALETKMLKDIIKARSEGKLKILNLVKRTDL